MATKKKEVRSYGTKSEETDKVIDPIEMEINGITVKAKPVVDGYTALSLSSAFNADSDDKSALVGAVLDYFKNSFDSTNWRLFERAIKRDDSGYSPIDPEALFEIFNDLVSAHNEDRP